MKMASRLMDLISIKTNCTCSTLFLLISKNQIARAARFFVFPLPLFYTTTTLFWTTKTSKFLVTHYFYGGIVICAYPIFCFLRSCSLLVFTTAHFLLAGLSLLAASISHFLTAALNFRVFFLRNSSPLFSITHSSSFSVVHVSVNIKNNAEKDTTLLWFFLSKSPGGRVIS